MLRCWRKLTLMFALLALVLTACVRPEETPFWDLAGEPGLLYWVKLHYERHAIEENGRCLHPQFEGMTRATILEDTDEQMVVTLGYAYTDFFRDGDDCNRFRLNRCFIMRECTGFGERTFTIARTPEGSAVVGMSGHRKERRAAQP